MRQPHVSYCAPLCCRSDRRRRAGRGPARTRRLAARLPDHPHLQLRPRRALSGLPVVLQLPGLPHGDDVLPGRRRAAPGVPGNALRLGLRAKARGFGFPAHRSGYSGHPCRGLRPRLIARGRLVQHHQAAASNLRYRPAKDLDIVTGSLAPAGDLQGPLRLGEQAMVAQGLRHHGSRSSPSSPAVRTRLFQPGLPDFREIGVAAEAFLAFQLLELAF